MICITVQEETIDELFTTLNGIYKSIDETMLPFWCKQYNNN